MINPFQLIIAFPIIMITITIHEYFHGWVALKLGDPTAKAYGRLSLNPIRHIDPMGVICFLLVGFGWAKPVPIQPLNFRRPLRDMMLASAAGPAANMMAALGFGILFKLVAHIPLLGSLVALGIFYNVAIAIFNLLPVYPLDGSHVLKGLLPPWLALKLSTYDRSLMWGLFAILILDGMFHTRILSRVLLKPIITIYAAIGGEGAVLRLLYGG